MIMVYILFSTNSNGNVIDNNLGGEQSSDDILDTLQRLYLTHSFPILYKPCV